MRRLLSFAALLLAAGCANAPVDQANAGPTCAFNSGRNCYDGTYRKLEVPYDGATRTLPAPRDGAYRKLEVSYDGAVRSLPAPRDGAYRKLEVSYDGAVRTLTAPRDGAYRKLEVPYDGVWRTDAYCP